MQDRPNLECSEGATANADNLTVHDCTEEEHDACLYNAMKVAKEYGLVFNLLKCMWKQYL